METRKKIAVYYAMPLCAKCRSEVSRVQQVASREKADLDVRFSLWNRIKHGLRLMTMPVVTVDERPFSVLGAFGEESLSAELKNK